MDFAPMKSIITIIKVMVTMIFAILTVFAIVRVMVTMVFTSIQHGGQGSHSCHHDHGGHRLEHHEGCV